MKFSIVIPVYNERATVATLLERVAKADALGLEKELIIVEGGSTDGTREVVDDFAKANKAVVIHEERPRGKGAAVREGLKRVTGDFVLIQDGDLEYSTDDYPKLLMPLVDGTADVVFGSRVMTSPQHWQFRRFAGLERIYGFAVNLGGVLFTALFNVLYGQRLSDGATMYKLFRAKDLKDLTLKSDVFDYDWEISAKLAKKGLRFAEAPVSYKARSRAEGKKIRFWRDGTRVLLAIIRYRLAD